MPRSAAPPTESLTCRAILAPEDYVKTGLTIFLAGSIHPEPNWQASLTVMLDPYPITILNPYRSDWDSSWKEDISFAPFAEQVNWELRGLEEADIIVVFFESNAPAPITLMELGLCVKNETKRIVVACEEEYWKRGNVQLTCARYGIEVLDTFEELEKKIKTVVEECL